MTTSNDKVDDSRRARIQRVRDFLKVWRDVRGNDDTIAITGAATVLRTSDLLHVIETIDVAQELLNRAKERGELMDVPQFAPSATPPVDKREESPTPRTDARLIHKREFDHLDSKWHAGVVTADFARQLERELAEAKQDALLMFRELVAEREANQSATPPADKQGEAKVAVTLTTHAAIDLLAEAFKQNHYRGLAAQLRDYKGFIQDKPLLTVESATSANMPSEAENELRVLREFFGAWKCGAGYRELLDIRDRVLCAQTPTEYVGVPE